MSEQYITYLLDELQPLGRVSQRRMFGVHGLFLNGLMFALVDDDTVYLKGDDQSINQYENAGCERFTYMKKTQLCHLSYYSAPDSTLDDPFELQHWAAIAIASAQRADLKKPPKKRKK